MKKFVISDSYNKEQVSISSEFELREFLYKKAIQGNSIVLFESPPLGALTIGVGNPYGFVEYMNKDAKPPYLIASDNDNFETEQVIEFDSGGTATPIPINLCLPLDKVVEIVNYFYTYEKLPQYIKWQEI